MTLYHKRDYSNVPFQINADDFGITRDISEGIIYAKRYNYIHSFSTMVNGSAFHQALQFILEENNSKTGLHATIVDGERALLDTHEILTCSKNNFYEKYSLILKIFKNKKIISEIKQEIQAQILTLKSQLISITHLDSHQHLHVLPGVSEIFVDLAIKYEIPSIRIPVSESYLKRNGIGMLLNIFSNRLKKIAQRRGLRVYNSFGFDCSGKIKESDLWGILERRSVKEDNFEIMVHPGLDGVSNKKYKRWHYNWESELDELRKFHKNQSV